MQEELLHDRRIRNVRVLGFHGTVDSRHTPGLREPIYAIEEYLVRIISREQSAVFIEKSKNTLKDIRNEESSFTVIGPWPAFNGYGIMVLGQMEKQHVQEIKKALPKRSAASVKRFIRWVQNPLGFTYAADYTQAQFVGNGLYVWHCTPDAAKVLRRAITKVAKKHLRKLLTETPKRDEAIKRFAWWLQRASGGAEDILLVARALEVANARDMAQRLLRSYGIEVRK